MPLPDGVTLRRATPEDAEALTHLHLDCWDDAYAGLIDATILQRRRTDLGQRVVTWRDWLTDGEVVHLAELTEDGRTGLVGFSGAGTGRDDDVDIDLELRVLYVRAAWWGTGIGYALLHEAISDRATFLWVLADNERGLRFYERQGFRLDGTEDLHDEGRHVRMLRAGT